MSNLVCQYCSHHNTGTESRCAHCGGPLQAVEQVLSSAAHSPALTRAEHAAVEATRIAATVEKVVGKGIPAWLWQVGGACVALVTVLGVAFAHSCSLPSLQVPELALTQSLPPAMRSIATCQHLDPSSRTDRCVIPATDPILLGGIAGGRDLAFTVEPIAPDRVRADVAHWRESGAVVVTDGPVFVAVGPSATVWFVNRLIGLRLETDAFASRAAAQTFIARSGLTT
ncbi:hypothetical protein ACFYO1_02465 [Nocardia sp. NPDC006044]|uniref:hypothetical protein n=1 Tax=Nocardia sp. NPDC006044 TaxID=3364306 RepID=UPI00369712A5